MLLRPMTLHVFWPCVPALLAIKLLFENAHRAGQANQIRQKEFAGELWIFDPRMAALRTAHRIAQRTVSDVPLVQQTKCSLEVLLVNFEPKRSHWLGDKPGPLVFGFVVNLRMDTSLFEALFERFSLVWLVESSNGYHVHKHIL